MKSQTCCQCNIRFDITDELYAARKSDGKAFYCPNGHQLVFKDTEVSKLKEQVAELETDRDIYKRWYEAEQRETKRLTNKLKATKGWVTRLKLDLEEIKGKVR